MYSGTSNHRTIAIYWNPPPTFDVASHFSFYDKLDLVFIVFCWLIPIDRIFLFSEIIRQRVFSHLAVPSHIWNSSPGVFYSAPEQLLYSTAEEERGEEPMHSFTAIVFTKSDPPVTSFKVPVQKMQNM